MKKTSRLLIGLAAAITATAPAFASSSAWHEAQGGRLRLVTTGKPDVSGRLQGALEIDLQPGWKTYWQDPGDAGVPPQVDISSSQNVSAAELSFPAPQRHDDGYSKWAGYGQPVTLPVTFTVPAPGDPVIIQANIFLGVCETICVPVQARFELDPATDPDNASDAAVIKAALAALPGQEQPDFGVTLVPDEGEALTVAAAFPGDASAVDFFIAGTDGYMFGPPSRLEKDGKLVFTVAVLDRPDTKPSGPGLPYTLTTAAGAVAGLLPYP